MPVVVGKILKKKLPRDDVGKSSYYPLETPDYVSVSTTYVFLRQLCICLLYLG